MDDKHFFEWIQIKKDLHNNARKPRILDGEVWWCSFGENVGIEINGKSKRFTRPVVIIKKLSSLGFMGVPLTSQRKSGSWYVGFQFLGKNEYAALCQARVISVSRLHDKMGQVSESDLAKIRAGFSNLYR